MPYQSFIPEQTFGGKALHLFKLREFGVNVPPFVVLSWEELNSCFSDSGVERFPETGVREILSMLTYNDEMRLAVRSSADVEDGQSHSFAGQFESLMNIGPDELGAAIFKVYQSAQSGRVRHYQGAGQAVRMAVIVQVCIDAEVSGVAFGMDPVSGDKALVLINAIYGMGEGLVAGELNSDQFVVNRVGDIKADVCEKKYRFDWSSADGLIKNEVSKTEISRASLDNRQVGEVYKAVKAIENHFAYIPDIEFCYKNSELYILQCRPVTTLAPQRDYLVWDNSNIIESYPGITLPLTFSFIRPVYASVYRELCLVLGVSKDVLNDNTFALENMLGLLRGRVYYNLYSWYKLLSLLPGFGINSAFMEKMMGVSERFELKDYKKPSGLKERFDVLRMLVSLLKNNLKLPGMRTSFRRMFDQVLKEQESMGIEQADAQVCMKAYYQFENVLTKNWKAPLVNDFFAMIHYGFFQKFIEKNQKYFPGNQNDYLMLTGSVITVEPARLQAEMGALIRLDPVLSQLFEEKDEREILNWISNHPEKKLSVLFNQYIEKWGDRCFAELKLETMTYRQSPALFVRILKQTFRQEFAEMGSFEEKKVSLPFFKKWLFRKLKNLAVQTVTERENLRYERTRAFAHVRKIFSRVGVLFKEAGITEHERDVFWLSKEEVFDYIKGTSIQLDVKRLIELRKSEYEAYEKEPEQSPRIRTEGITYSNYFGPSERSNDQFFKGIPCCRGVVRAEVKILHGPDDLSDLKGKIAVTRSTDPGWVSVFPLVQGILVERGSVLSHAAIVSREMNIPCIVGIRNICETLKDGDVVEMDGLSGEIRIIR